ncbi:MAG: NADH-quinone oxidoreductase subunit NuoF [Firmicutes bacterium]|nr:NADH-quinone oxidoreductase subunit NuoF [Bacillota bacterium]
MSPFIRAHILVCSGAGCVSSGCHEVYDSLMHALEEEGILSEVKVIKTGCIGSCDLGPTILIYPDGTFYQKVTPPDAKEIVAEHIVKGRPVKRLFPGEAEGEPCENISSLNFFKKQVKVVLRNCGVIDPENIYEYVARDGYEALARVLTDMTPKDVIDTIKESGLRGRGGAGFPTGLKWEFARRVRSDEKYVVCNADEGDPGAFMDRSVLEGDPHSIVEAMTIAGYAIGANQGHIYVRAEYPLAVSRLTHAIEEAHKFGVLGENLFGSGFSFDLDIRVGAGAFVCGEETALLASMEGKRGMPRPRPPFPANEGLFRKPTLINNVETYANIVPIILKGPDWFRSIGTEKSPGTKVFALAGKINNTGLVEVPMGTTLREIVYEIGGGIPGGKAFKAAQTGGPSGGCIPESLLDISMEYDTLTKAGAMMGSGGLIIMDEDTCMVDIAKFFLQFTQDESCGKCVPCREGTKVMLDILTRITEGKGQPGDIETLESLGNTIRNTALCGLGQTAPNPVLSSIRYFREEYEAHIDDKRCPGGVCKDLVGYAIDASKCRGCSLCAKACPAQAIHQVAGEATLAEAVGGEGSHKPKRRTYEIDNSKCQKCGECMSVCRFDAVSRR